MQREQQKAKISAVELNHNQAGGEKWNIKRMRRTCQEGGRWTDTEQGQTGELCTERSYGEIILAGTGLPTKP